MGTNSIANNCEDEDGLILDDEELEDIRSCNRMKLMDIASLILNEAKLLSQSGKDIIVVSPPPRLDQKKNLFPKCGTCILEGYS